MNGLPVALREVLACPKCRGPLRDGTAGSSLECEACALRYPVRDGIPVLLASQAEPMDR